MKLSLSLFIAVLLFSSCEDYPRATFKTGIFMASEKNTTKYVSKSELNAGMYTYAEHCAQCHGHDGRGNGPAAKALLVPPRNLTTGVYKWGRVLAGELPTDEDFYRILRRGLHGTVMLPWDLGDQEMHDLVQYIKTFAPEIWQGKDKVVGETLTLKADPFGAIFKESAIKKGEYAYHMKGNCQSCHPAYVSPEKLSAFYKEEYGEALSEVDPTLWQLKPQQSTWDFKVIPPDFTWHEIRSASSVSDLAVRIAAGIAGSGMPSWKDVLTDEELWAVSYYVKSLMEIQGDIKRREELLQKTKYAALRAANASQE